MDTEVNCLAVSSNRVKSLKDNEINFAELVANESRMLCLSYCWKELVFLLVFSTESIN